MSLYKKICHYCGGDFDREGVTYCGHWFCGTSCAKFWWRNLCRRIRKVYMEG